MSTWVVYTDAPLAVAEQAASATGAVLDQGVFVEDGWADEAIHDTAVDFYGTLGDEHSEAFVTAVRAAGFTAERFDELHRVDGLRPARV